MNALLENDSAFSLSKGCDDLLIIINNLKITMTINKIKKPSFLKRESYGEYTSDPSEIYSSNDLGLSSALMCADFELLSINKDNPKRACFVFSWKAGIEETANSYFADKLELRARSFFDAIKALKSKLYNQ
jgi:hypothetical protein